MIDFVRGSGYNITCVFMCSNGRLFNMVKRFNMGYLSISQTAEKWGISGRRVQRLCSEGRIPGATKIGSYWAVPDGAEKPKDKRIKTGRYIKQSDIKNR